MAEKDTQDQQPQDQQSPTTDDLLRQLLAEQQENRAAVAQLRNELAQTKQQPAPPPSPVALSDERLMEIRMQEIGEHDFYCPGCGALYDRPRECVGRGEAPHSAIEVISTDELRGDDPSKHTAAPGVRP